MSNESLDKYRVHTFGCKVNSYDSGLLQKRMGNAGFELSDNPHVHILNTCAVTAEATKQAVREIRRLKSKDPFSTVVVTGCAAQVDTDAFSDLKAADLVVANSHKGLLPQILRDFYSGKSKEKVYKSNIFRKDDLEEGGGVEAKHTRSFLKIQDGCNSFCTYCVIPFGRGKSRSLSVNYIVNRVKQLEAVGTKEVVLTGVHIGDYEDGNNKLEDLVEAVLKFTTVPRIRMTSLEPPEVTDRLLDLYADERMCKHFHMSIQSANTKVLSMMKRQYDAKSVERSLLNIEKKVPHAFVGMDVIVGFPQESVEEFEDAYRRLESLPWTRIHVFPFSSRPGTKAEKIDKHINGSEIKRRSKVLRELSSERYASLGHNQVGRIKKTLLLKNQKNESNLIQGLTRDYWPIQVSGANESMINQEVTVDVTGFEPHMMSRMDGVLFGCLKQ